MQERVVRRGHYVLVVHWPVQQPSSAQLLAHPPLSRTWEKIGRAIVRKCVGLARDSVVSGRKQKQHERCTSNLSPPPARRPMPSQSLCSGHVEDKLPSSAPSLITEHGITPYEVPLWPVCLSFCPTPSIYLLYKEKALMLWRHCSAISRVLLWYQRWFSHRFKSQHIWAAVEKLHHSQTSTVHQPDSPPPCTDKPAAEGSLAGSPPSASETFSCRKWDQNQTERNHMVSSKTPRWNKSQNGTWRTNFTYSSWAKNNILNISMVSFSFPLMKFALG